MVDYLIHALKEHADLPKLEDFVPVAVVLDIFFGKTSPTSGPFLEASKKEGTVHGILLKLGVELPDELRERIKKLKANTFQEGVITNMLDGIKASKEQSFEKVLFALGIRNIGENTAQLLARHFGSIEKLQAASSEQLLDINGVGRKRSSKVSKTFSHRRRTWSILSD